MADNQQISKLNIKGTVFDIVDEYARSKIYEAPTYTAKSSGLYKITVDGGGHVSATAAVTASDLPSHTHDHSHTQYLTSLSHSHTQYITTNGTGLSKNGQTLSLKPASTSEIGGILPYTSYNYDITNFLESLTPDSGNHNYGITIDTNGLAFVGLPEFSLTSHSHSQYATTGHSHTQYLTAHQSLAHSHTQYLTSLAHSHTDYITTAGTGLSKSSQTLNLKAATTTEIGGIKVKAVGTTAVTTVGDGSTFYGVNVDKNNLAYVALNLGHSHSNYLTSLAHDHSQYATTSHSHSQYATTGHSHSNYLTAHQSLAHSHSQYAFGTGTLANLTGATSSTDNTGKLWGSYTLVQWMSDIIGADLSAISSTSAEIEKILEDNDVSTGLLKRISSLESGKADKSATVSTINYNRTPGVSGKFTKTINGTTTDVVTAATIVYDGLAITDAGTGLSKGWGNSSYSLSLNAATTTEIGGIKVKAVGTTAVTTVGDGSTFYGVNVDKNNLAYVALELGHSHSNYLTSLAHSHSQYATTGHSHSQYLTAHQSLSHSHTEYITTNGTGLSKSAQTLNLKTASTTEIGGIKVSFTTANNTANIADVTGSSAEYGLSIDKNNLAYISLPDFSLSSHSHSQYLTSLGHSHSQYLTAHQNLAHSHTQYATTGHSHSDYITTAGTGLSKSSQTLNLKAATTTEIGGIKVKAVGTTAVTTVGDGSTFYGVNVDKNNLAYVALNLSHSHSNYLTSLAHSHSNYLTAHQSLSHSHSEYVRLDNVWYNSTTKTLNIGVAPA